MTKNKATKEIKQLQEYIKEFSECIDSQFKNPHTPFAYYLGDRFMRYQYLDKLRELNKKLNTLAYNRAKM